MSTPERLARHTWWPTKQSSPADKFVGSEACVKCHVDIAKSQRESEMGRTLMPAEQSKAAEYAGKTITVDGFTYEFLTAAEKISVAIHQPTETPAKPLTWAFGSGAISQVYLSPDGNSYNESHFSFFEPIHGFDVTPAQPNIRVNQGPEPSGDSTMRKALGRTVSQVQARRCFSCHAANVPGEGPIAGFVPGVTCETCHGPGANHVAAARSQLPQSGALIFNPRRLQPVDRVDFCGACHATSIDVQLAGSVGVPSVRFPAYRLQNSACWRNDERIQCTACHDPHKPLLHGTSAYDERCLSCHQTNTNAKPDASHPGRACPTAVKDCAGCHMPKYDFPDVHHKFTDHDIRVVKPGERAPA